MVQKGQINGAGKAVRNFDEMAGALQGTVFEYLLHRR